MVVQLLEIVTKNNLKLHLFLKEKTKGSVRDNIGTVTV